jgi:carbonic anhydrase/acetyltransferase-like protein (isoleucine patch superfamily)
VSPVYRIGERSLEGDRSAFIAPGAVIVGSVLLEADCSVWFNAVLRADNDRIVVGEGTNIQDGAVLHTDEGLELVLGHSVTVGHNAVIHGCSIGSECLIGINAVILNRVAVGANCLIGANTLIPEGKEIPDNSVVMGSPGRVVRQVSPDERARILGSARHYRDKARMYSASLFPGP